MKAWRQFTLTIVSVLTSGLYINILSSELMGAPEEKLNGVVRSLGWWNLLLVIFLSSVLGQAILAGTKYKKRKKYKDEVINSILRAATESLLYPSAHRHLRAIVTLSDESGGTRTTRYSYNAEADPERVATYPVEFGVTGKAYRKRSVVVEELPQDHHAIYDSSTKDSVLPEIRTILAAPILRSNRPEDEPYGVLAFDSTLTSKTLQFNRPQVRALAQHWADTLAIILRQEGE